ncbi:MAG: hypothetical protein K0R39_3227 [Symbiobacteriaceae bacterium]|nr:hypothetical protein [Symbiobacteriaceae bacterium]
MTFQGIIILIMAGRVSPGNLRNPLIRVIRGKKCIKMPTHGTRYLCVNVMMTGAAVHTIYNLRTRAIGAHRGRNMLLSALTAAACAAAVLLFIKLIV